MASRTRELFLLRFLRRWRQMPLLLPASPRGGNRNRALDATFFLSSVQGYGLHARDDRP